MARVSVHRTVDESGLQAMLRPRTDVVVERPDGKGKFGLEKGPFESYQRTVRSYARRDGTYDVEERTRFKLAIPVWGWFFVPIIWYTLRRPRNDDKPAWWLPPDVLDARASRILSLLCVFSAFGTYIAILITQTNPWFSREFGSSETEISFVAIAVRLGAVLALLITLFADRRGRRKVLLAATTLAIVAAASGAVAPNLWVLGGTQTIARACASAMLLLIAIMAAEEMPAGARAFAVSMLAVSAVAGAGGVVLFLHVGELASWAWRIFFAVPLLFLAAMPTLRRVLPETRRFEVYEAHELRIGRNDTASPEPDSDTKSDSDGGTGPAASPASASGEHTDTHHVGGGVVEIESKGRRFAALGSTAVLFAVFSSPASFYMNEWLHGEQGFSGGMISLFQVVTNVPLGGIAIAAGGWLADKHGRRLIGAAGIAGGVGFTVLMYISSGWAIWVFSALATGFGTMAVPALGVYGSELFSTSNRGAANGGLNLLGVLGGVFGLFAAAQLAETWGGQYSHAMPLLSIGPLLAVGIILVFYPETAKVELEALNPEDSPPPSTVGELEELEHDLDEALAKEHPGHHRDNAHRGFQGRDTTSDASAPGPGRPDDLS